jgi:cobaltochelatase CobN
MSAEPRAPVVTRRRVLGQVVVCKGCCCGQTGKGRPSVPEERLKATWKSERLHRVIQLTISGCLGPCDVPNVVQIITSDGIKWFGRLEEDAHYDALIDWARACRTACAIVPGPTLLSAYKFEGYITEHYRA